MAKLILFYSLLFFVAACGTRSVDTAACDRTPIKHSAYTFRNDQFVAAALAQDLTRRVIDGLYAGDASRTSKLSKNVYTAGEYDTTVVYQRDCDSIVYIASKANSIPMYASWQSGKITLDRGFVKPGLPKDAFVKKFRLPATVPDVIRITETEGANEFILVFSAGVLIRIQYLNLYVE